MPVALMRPALLTVALFAVGCGAQSENTGVEGMLSGTVTTSGQPIPFVALTVTAPDGTIAGGAADEKGFYRIPSPPKGMLKFQFDVPGDPGQGMAIPAKYSQPGNEVTFESDGGTQTFDIKLD